MVEYSQTLVGQMIIGSLERAPKSFDKLLKICHSIFPDELQAILDGMVNDRIIRKKGILSRHRYSRFGIRGCREILRSTKRIYFREVNIWK